MKKLKEGKRMKWYLFTDESGARHLYNGIACLGAILLPSKEAAEWKWSNGSYCFN